MRTLDTMEIIARVTPFAYIFLFAITQQVMGLLIFKGRMNMKRFPRLWLELILLNGAAILFPLYLSGIVRIEVGLPTPARLIGVGLVAAGYVLSMWANWVLGSNWIGGVGLHEDHTLVTKGPFSRIRHPLYAGIGLSMIGVTVASSLNLIAAVAAFCFWATFSSRIGLEELVLQKFGTEYREYRSRTGYFFPRLRGPKVSDQKVPDQVESQPPRSHSVAPVVVISPKRPTNVARREAARRKKRRRR